MAPYIASKFAVAGLTESLHYELQGIQSPVKISLLVPGPVNGTAILEGAAVIRTQDEQSERFIESLREAQQGGLSPEEFARRVFDSISKGEYWIVPQSEYLNSMVRERSHLILQRAEPRSPIGD